MTCSRFTALALSFIACYTALAQPDTSPPAPLHSNAPSDVGDDILPFVATDRAGNWVTVWSSSDTLEGTSGADNDILVARSSDNGQTWTDPAALNTNAASDSATDSDHSPVVATDGKGHWVTVWYATVGILSATSDDNGATWTAPVVLGNIGILPIVATDGKGNWLTVWESSDTLGGTIGTDDDILEARSTNNGLTWSTPVPVNNHAYTDSTIGEIAGVSDTRPFVATDNRGTWVAAWEWQAGFDSDVDIMTAISSDNGLTWTDGEWLNANAFNDSDADFSPVLATDSKGNWLAVWWCNEKNRERKGFLRASDFDIRVSRSKTNGLFWTWPTVVNTNAASDKRGDYRPTIKTDAKGTWIVAWESDDTLGDTIGKDDDVLFASSTDTGRTWTAPMLLNTNAATDARDDGAASIATDGMGNWMAAWHSNDTLGNTLGADFDILAATMVVPPLGLHVLVPNDGERWKAGSQQKIRWESTDAAGPDVKLELLQDGNVVETIKNSTPNDGAYSWTLNADLAFGKDYKVRLTSTGDPGITDESDGKFRIKAAE